eukprot:gene3952-4206_t
MSKKNNRKIIARKHAHDLALEKAAKEKAQKAQQKSERKKERQLAATGAVKTKRKGLKLKKGFRVKGIKITDADSKKRVLQILKREQAAQVMEVEQPAAALQTESDKRRKKKGKLKVATKNSGGRRSGSSSSSRPAAELAPMET